MVYEFESFPHVMSGVLEGSTTYYMTIRSVCGEDNYSDWVDNGNDGPDQWTTSSCLSVYTLPYFNDFGEADASGNPTQEVLMPGQAVIHSTTLIQIALVQVILISGILCLMTLQPAL